MNTSDLKKLSDKLAHDLRGPIHSAKLNLEAAQALAKKSGGSQTDRLLKHLELIANEMEKLQNQIKDFTAQLK
jgi:hypothetical protein